MDEIPYHIVRHREGISFGYRYRYWIGPHKKIAITFLTQEDYEMRAQKGLLCIDTLHHIDVNKQFSKKDGKAVYYLAIHMISKATKENDYFGHECILVKYCDIEQAKAEQVELMKAVEIYKELNLEIKNG